MGPGGGGGFFAGPPGRFDMQYQCYPVSFINKEDLEKGNKIILPPSALDHLARLNISYPMLFEVSNPASDSRTHCGVLEFIAEEGICFLPYWMMCNLTLREGDIIRIMNTSLPKGNYVKLQPVTKDFLDIHNPRAVLENTLRNFATLTVGDNIMINYNDRNYEIEIVETRPAKAVSIIETDVNVDFAPPKDYVPPEQRALTGELPVPAAQTVAEPARPQSALFSGSGSRLDGKSIIAKAVEQIVIDEEDDKPWKNRRPGGVRKTKPFSIDSGHMTGKRPGEQQSNATKARLLWAGGGNTLEG